MRNNSFDILIVGAGHAGIEAAQAASQFTKLKVGVLTKSEVGIGSTPCNPAIGGVGKGQLVREISAMGGAMGFLADSSAIQCRHLNESKGDAVKSTRFQVDKTEYSASATKLIRNNPNIHLILGELKNIQCTEENKFCVELSDSSYIECKKLVLTVGTFFNGTLHRGDVAESGGRVGCSASVPIKSLDLEIALVQKKFKTGTPPRISKNSVNFEKMEVQNSDASVMNFNYIGEIYERLQPQMACYKTHTNSKTIGIVLRNKDNSPMFNGQIKGVGPRYCPSIEDKAFRYPEKHDHHIFIEPEGKNLDTIYPNGISTSLPESVQLELLQSINGLEDSSIVVPGYAVEYDVVDTSFLNHSLEYSKYPGLYFAGQVNGTSGYEEAAAQGLVAGLNSALALLGKNPLIFPRRTSYIGVLIDDLVSNKREEPYRLFTARAENRLFIREDNAINRLGEYRLSLGLNNKIDKFLKDYFTEWSFLENLIKRLRTSQKYNLKIADSFKNSKSFNDYLLSDVGLRFNFRVVHAFYVTEKYRGYIKRQSEASGRLSRLDNKVIDPKKLVETLPLSRECAELIEEFRPKSFFHLRNIKGIRPATLSLVANTI